MMNNWKNPDDTTEGLPLGVIRVPPARKKVSTGKCPIHRASQDSSCRLCFPTPRAEKSASLPPLAFGTLPDESPPMPTTVLETKTRSSWATKPVSKMTCVDVAFMFKNDFRSKRPVNYQFNELSFASAIKKFRNGYGSCPEQELRLIKMFFSLPQHYQDSMSSQHVCWGFIKFAQKHIHNMPVPVSAEDQEVKDEVAMVAALKAMGIESVV